MTTKSVNHLCGQTQVCGSAMLQSTAYMHTKSLYEVLESLSHNACGTAQHQITNSQWRLP